MLAVVVADGEPAPDDALLARGADLVVAADGGARWLAAHGIQPQLVVGDLDSLDESEVERLQASGTRVDRHPRAKDASDTELALEAALAAGADRITLVGGLVGGRLDHQLANLMLLVDPALARVDLRVVRGATLVRGITGANSLAIEAGLGEVVTLLPIGGDATGVSTAGLRYALDDESLVMGRSRGLSNEVVETPASVSLRAGSLLVIEIGSSMEGET
jgi:thiamine pyrophosphokinase